MFVKGEFYVAGWIYLILIFILYIILPDWTGRENGVIENLQLLWLLAGIHRCWKARHEEMYTWGGHQPSLWYAGIIYFFLLFMREISWGRTLLTHPDGSYYEYSEMGLYGQLVHSLVGLFIAAALILLWRAKVWRYLYLVKIPLQSFTLLLIYIFLAWLAEKTHFAYFNGAVAEELSEFGAYMMMYYLLDDSIKNARDKLEK